MEKAVFLDDVGGPEKLTLKDHDPGAPGPGDILVRNTAIGLNFIDIYLRRGLYPASLPAILGQEAAGIVETVGSEVAGFKPGDRVAYLSGGGAYATATVCPAGVAAKIPDGVDDEIAAASFLKGLTVHMLVRDVFALGPRHSCLVYAASGGVGTLLVQWAASLGARVIAVVGADKKAAAAKANGASDIIIRTKTASIAADVKTLTEGRGVDVVYDSVGAATFEASLDSLAQRGHMVTYGNASGPVPAVQPLELARRGSLTLIRPTLFHFATPERLPTMAATLFEMIANGTLKPHIAHRFAMSEIQAAHRRLESGDTTGSIIITP